MRVIGTLLSGLLAVSAAGQIVTTMTVEPARVLRGVPVSLALTLTNSGRTAVPVPRYFTVDVTLPDGTVIAPGFHEKRMVRTVPDEYAEARPLQPDETRTLYLPLGHSLTQPGVFADLRLAVPGRHVIKAVLDDRLAQGRYANHQDGLRDPAVTTTDAQYEVITGTRADEHVWDGFLRMTGGRAVSALTTPEQRKLGAALLPMATDSGYRAHLLLMQGPTDLEPWLAIIHQARPLLTDHPHLYDELSLTLVRLHKSLAYEAAAQGNHRLAQQRYHAARTLLDGFTPKTDLGRRRAEVARKDMNALPTHFRQE